jgi:hemoglobin-like flavoprotein
LGLLLNYPSQKKSDPPILERLAERHSKADLAIEPPLYDSFLEALVTTIGKFDPQYTAEIGDAWRKAVTPGIEYMKSKY